MAASVVNFDELHQQTGGDEALVREVLQLFLVHAPADLQKLIGVTGYERRVLAHRLVGSARAVGAADVSRMASSVEAGRDEDVPALAIAVAEAVRFVKAYLAGQSA